MNVDGMITGPAPAVKGPKPLESRDFSPVRRFANSTPNND
jgi:hypothetical protein